MEGQDFTLPCPHVPHFRWRFNGSFAEITEKMCFPLFSSWRHLGPSWNKLGEVDRRRARVKCHARSKIQFIYSNGITESNRRKRGSVDSFQWNQRREVFKWDAMRELETHWLMSNSLIETMHWGYNVAIFAPCKKCGGWLKRCIGDTMLRYSRLVKNVVADWNDTLGLQCSDICAL